MTTTAATTDAERMTLALASALRELRYAAGLALDSEGELLTDDEMSRLRAARQVTRQLLELASARLGN